MAVRDDGPDRAWYLAEMQRQLAAFDWVRVQIRELKITYLKQQLLYLNDMSGLDPSDPEYKARWKLVRDKVLAAHDRYSALPR